MAPRRRLCLLFFLFFALSLASWADAAEKRIVRIEGTSARDNALLIELGYDIVGARPGVWTDLIVSSDRIDQLTGLGYPVVSSRQLPVSIPGDYHRYVEMVPALQQMAADYPEIAMLEDIGDGWGKIYDDPSNYPYHDIWALKISDQVQTDEAEPEILFTGVHHAREPVTLEICLGIADELLSNYGTDPEVTSFVDRFEIWIVPLVNPDGHWCVTDVNWTDWRKNIRDNDGNGYISEPGWWVYPDGVDNNRNYSWAWGGLGSDGNPNAETYRGPSAFSEPENQTIRDLAQRENFAFSIDYHSYGRLVMYPYGFDNSTEAPDEPLLHTIAVSVRDAIAAGYVAQQANDLYPAAGASLDWHYGANNTMALLIEVGTEFIPPGNQIAGIVTENVRGAKELLRRVDGPGVRGIVRIEGVPGEATIELVGTDDPALNESRRSHPLTGDYYRITPPGVHTLRFHVDGYDDQDFQVTVGNDTFEVLDVEFGSGTGIATNEELNRLFLAVQPNPTRASTTVWFRVPSGRDGAWFSVHDLAGRLVSRSFHAKTEGSFRVDAIDDNGLPLAAGVYLLRMEAGRERAVRRIVLLP